MRTAIAVVTASLLIVIASPAGADVAPPSVDSCYAMPEGSPCTMQGRTRGICVKANGLPACRAVAALSASPASSTTAQSSDLPQPAPETKRQACGIHAGAAGGSWDGMVLALIALDAWRRRRARR